MRSIEFDKIKFLKLLYSMPFVIPHMWNVVTPCIRVNKCTQRYSITCRKENKTGWELGEEEGLNADNGHKLRRGYKASFFPTSSWSCALMVDENVFESVLKSNMKLHSLRTWSKLYKNWDVWTSGIANLGMWFFYLQYFYNKIHKWW